MAFDFEIDMHGAYIVTTRARLSTASLHGPEIEAQITGLKKELDELAMRMKRAVEIQLGQLLDLG